MARVTIYLTDELTQKLKERRPHINVSHICAEALQQFVANKEPNKTIDARTLTVLLAMVEENMRSTSQNFGEVLQALRNVKQALGYLEVEVEPATEGN